METHGFERVTLWATNGMAPAALHHAAALEGGRCVDPIRMPYIGQFDDGAISSDPPTDRKDRSMTGVQSADKNFFQKESCGARILGFPFPTGYFVCY